MSVDQTAARESVRRVIQDGQTADGPYNLARLEDLSDEIPAQATPTQTQFLLRFESTPVQEYATVFCVPGTLTAYLDGSAIPTTPTVDVDRNGNFTLPVAPHTDLKVSYGWQWFQDTDVDDLVDKARAWLDAYATVDLVPDGLTPALVKYAAALACRALQRKVALADARAGDAELKLSQLAQAYGKQADALEKEAVADRTSFSQRPERLAPTAQVASLGLRPYQPRR